MKDRIIYINGQFVPSSEARIHIFDMGFMRGEGIFEAIRTFNGKPFKLPQHIKRLFKSLKYARLDPKISSQDMEKITQKVIKANKQNLSGNEDLAIGHFITPGLATWYDPNASPTIIVYCRDIVFKDFAKYYTTGAHVITPPIRHIPPQCIDPKMKTLSRMHHRIARVETQLNDPEAYPLFQDLAGNVTESTSMNFFIVKEGKLLTSNTNNILCGISRETVLELAEDLSIPYEERDIQLYEVYNADEAFATATGPCVLPISRVNGIQISSKIPGKITKSLLDRWSQNVKVSIVAQATAHIN